MGPAVRRLRGPSLALAITLLGLLPPRDTLKAASLVPTRLRCENTPPPAFVDSPSPRLSWVLAPADNSRNRRQLAYEIQAARSLEDLQADKPDLWSSGRVDSRETTDIPYAGRPLASSQPVHWRVRVWDDTPGPSAWSETASWTSAILAPEDWKARWLSTDFQPPGTPGLPVFRHGFTTRLPVTRALVHVTGLGHFKLLLDGAPVGSHFLDPAWSVYEKTTYYSTFDITDALRTPGRHAFAVLLGKGFYNTAGDRRVHGVQSSRPLRMILQAHLTYGDGTGETVVSDGSWRVAAGPITHSAILGGEDHDARRLPPGWAKAEFDDATWAQARVVPAPPGNLRAAECPPMAVHEVFPPRGIDEPEPGVFVVDFGQNASAIPSIRVRGRAGDVIRLIPAEQRHGMSPRRNDGRGPVNPAGVGHPNHFSYTLRGDPAGEAWTPEFSYSGFQYLQVEGAVPAGHPNPDGRPVIEEIRSLHVRNTAPEVGTFACSNPLLNDIDRLIQWAVRANLAHVLTDCPHREKLGWLEVSYLLGPSLAGRHDLTQFYRKIARDIRESQLPDGQVPTVAPAYPAFAGGFAATPEWGAAVVLDPWLLFEWYGDQGVLEAQFEAMKAYVAFLGNSATRLVPAPGLGDWYDYGHGQAVGASRFTPPELSAMATFHRCARVVADAARELGRTGEERHHRELAARIAAEFHARWFVAPAEYRNLGSPQTANSMALMEGLAPPALAPAVFDRLVADLQDRHLQQTSGDVGHAYLLQALARHGRSDILHSMVRRTDIGSYGFFVRNGWTSLPEAWDANTGASMNHCMLGHIQEWFLGWVAGIRPDPAGPGFRRFLVDPQPGGELSWARGSYDSIRGPILAEWRLQDGRFHLRLRVPPNTLATLRLPAAAGTPVTEGGLPVADIPGLGSGDRTPDRAVFTLGGGEYRFESTP